MSARDESAPAATVSGNVTRLLHDGREIFLVGTAHVSKKSVDEVRRVIDELRPDVVCVELDAARYDSLRDDSGWRGLDARDILRSDRAGLFLASLLFAGFQKRLGDRLGVRPGMEMLAAVEEAHRTGANVVLADREIQATLMRCYRSLGPVDRMKVLLILVMLPFTASEIDEAEVEKLKDREKMGDVMEAFAREMPALGTPLIDERDRYLMASVQEAEGKRIVAVVGAAHVPGMSRRLGERVDRAALSVIPPRSGLAAAVEWIPSVAVAAIVAGAAARDPFRVVRVLELVALPSAAVTGLFAAIAGASVIAVIAAALLSPLTLVLPMLRVGPLSGLVELRRGPPTPADNARIRDDVLSPRAARKNPFLRPLLIAVATAVGRSLGGAIGIAWAVGWLLFG
ncbi:MAG TPA: TraB family protein [Polyangiaceae bacterium]|nr:TraB family protein [Polyangiaceae bacterium]